MNYETFKETVKRTIEQKLGLTYKVSIHQAMKTNTVLDGLTILKEDENISPSIYLNSYYSQMIAGRAIQDIVDEIFDIYLKSRNTLSFKPEDFMDFELVKGKIIYKLINTDKNTELLKDIPSLQFHDLSIVFYYLVEMNDREIGSILIHNNHMEIWNTDVIELKRLADINTPSLLPYSLKSMNSVMEEILTQEFELSESDHGLFNDVISNPHNEAESMYVLTNTKGINGAAVLFYSQVLEQFSKSHGSFFILPSSIHEVLLVPVNSGVSKENLTDMVIDVNRTQLAPEEILSDNVYFFDADTHLISM